MTRTDQAPPEPPPLDAAAGRASVAPGYADVVLDNLSRRFPYAAHHATSSPADQRLPRALHPAFHTAYDWHSCVHMHALGVSLLEFGLDRGRDAALRRALARNLTAGKLLVEARYLRDNPGWERPYGWAWLAGLAAACASSPDDEARQWGLVLEPVVDVVGGLVLDWLARARWPVRHGVHTNSAFGLGLLLDAFVSLGLSEEADACAAAAHAWFGTDRDWPQRWELSGQDFLSAGLSSADLMRRVLAPTEFADWFSALLPGLSGESRILLPVGVSDETDGSMVHLHGLNLSRAGQAARIAAALEGAGAGAAASTLREAVRPLLAAGLSAVVSNEFMSSHWLATFAWDAICSAAMLEATDTRT